MRMKRRPVSVCVLLVDVFSGRCVDFYQAGSVGGAVLFPVSVLPYFRPSSIKGGISERSNDWFRRWPRITERYRILPDENSSIIV